MCHSELGELFQLAGFSLSVIPRTTIQKRGALRYWISDTQDRLSLADTLTLRRARRPVMSINAISGTTLSNLVSHRGISATQQSRSGNRIAAALKSSVQSLGKSQILGSADSTSRLTSAAVTNLQSTLGNLVGSLRGATAGGSPSNTTLKSFVASYLQNLYSAPAPTALGRSVNTTV